MSIGNPGASPDEMPPARARVWLISMTPSTVRAGAALATIRAATIAVIEVARGAQVR